MSMSPSVASVVPAQAPALSPQQAAPLDAAIDAALREQRLVGAVVLVAHAGQCVYRRAAGWADREARRPLREDATFRLASVSKPIVATAALALVAQGRLQLDAPIARWLPWFRPALPDGRVPDISLRQLLSHSAGLGYRFLDPADGAHARAGVSDGMDNSGLSLEDNLRRLAQVPLQYAPGAGWGYSLSIDVAGALLQAASGQPLPQLVRDLVTAPLGMHATAFHAEDAARLAVPYVNGDPAPHRLGEGEVVAPFAESAGIVFHPSRALDPQAFASAGAGMVGSADDVLRLLETLRRGGAPLLPAALVAEMGRAQAGDLGPPDAPGWGYGLGFAVLRDPAPTATPEAPGTWRWGGAYGHSWFVDPARQLSVVAMTNTLYEGMSGTVVTELRDAVYASLRGVPA
ncbi:serine hydrolase [Xanthomonas translucens pv. arrhenatheri]|uniref:Esterase EstB n=1 Tax=Xanthomonas graminis pv. arrhenatheri LMG 727 TaxID=1195923 RepID=A0A0K2ZPA3_9XANT|nr:serine hydrolase domain-containing protein [Xanthomonas translucens]OAX65275.1 serine hydrolase [Xanthomonas translucens pv. arrhenatheri]UKE76395.1 beta-lactamase family protein [Xanthomonas translucens pv. arrhenatheri]CTP86807.1 Esterase EstB [Xanthomonas translucens pv. arrhenatheri LMG 727]